MVSPSLSRIVDSIVRVANVGCSCPANVTGVPWFETSTVSLSVTSRLWWTRGSIATWPSVAIWTAPRRDDPQPVQAGHGLALPVHDVGRLTRGSDGVFRGTITLPESERQPGKLATTSKPRDKFGAIGRAG